MDYPKNSILTSLHWCDLLKVTAAAVDRRSVLNSVTYFHGLSHNDPMVGATTALAQQLLDRGVLSHGHR